MFPNHLAQPIPVAIGCRAVGLAIVTPNHLTSAMPIPALDFPTADGTQTEKDIVNLIKQELANTPIRIISLLQHT